MTGLKEHKGSNNQQSAQRPVPPHSLLLWRQEKPAGKGWWEQLAEKGSPNSIPHNHAAEGENNVFSLGNFLLLFFQTVLVAIWFCLTHSPRESFVPNTFSTPVHLQCWQCANYYTAVFYCSEQSFHSPSVSLLARSLQCFQIRGIFLVFLH